MTLPALDHPKIAFVGAGPSAVYALKHLAGSRDPLDITIFEKGRRPGVGTPYDREQNSSVMLANIASIELPPVCEDLLTWLGQLPAAFRASLGIDDNNLNDRHFFPRVLIGDYFADQFASLVALAEARGHTINVQLGVRVIDIAATDSGVLLTTDNAVEPSSFVYDHVIIATGHSAPQSRRPLGTPNVPPALGDVGVGTRRIGILGTSLSAIDAAIDVALRFGKFVRSADKLRFELAPEVSPLDRPAILMMSRRGLLPEADFYCPIPYLPLRLFTPDRVHALVNGAMGDLDRVFQLFLEQLRELDEQFVLSLGDVPDTPEAFAESYFNRRRPYDAFEWARANLLEATFNARFRRTVEWRYALLRMHEPFGDIVKHLLPDERRRFNASMKPVFVDNYAAVPPISVERLIALHDAGVLTVRSVGSDYTIEPGGIQSTWIVQHQGEALCFDTIIDARGQATLSQGEFPFPTLRMQMRMQAQSHMAEADEVFTCDGYTLGKRGSPLERIHCLSLPFLLDRNPFVQGLTSAEQLGIAAAGTLLRKIGEIGAASPPSAADTLADALNQRVIFLFAGDAGPVPISTW